MIYNWQQPDWPDFRYTLQSAEDMLFAIAEATGHIGGTLKTLPEPVQTETLIALMVAEAVKTSAIEGEYLSRPDVISSIRNRLGLNTVEEPVKDQRAKGAAALMLAVRDTYAEPLSEAMLFTWHELLLSHVKRLRVGRWRTHKEPMQVVSGAIGKEKIHFEAPPSHKVPAEMQGFIQWFNDTAPGGSREIRRAPVRAAIAHLYFESIHPFEDGNGRIGRAIAEKALSQGWSRPAMLSLSHTIEADRSAYYRALEQAQRNNEITPWMLYFIAVIHEAQQSAKLLVDFTLRKARFLDRHKPQLNERQLKTLLRMLESPEGFEGGMTARKYMSITKASKATATRDLQSMAQLGVFRAEGSGRSVRYVVVMEE